MFSAASCSPAATRRSRATSATAAAATHGEAGVAHLVCVRVTAEFLDFSVSRGNDLVTPNPAMRFRGLKPGDRWCLHVLRWREAWEAGCAPRVVLESTNEKVLEHVPLTVLKRYALDLH